MTGYKIVNLKLMIDTIGEDKTRAVLSTFSCPLNKDVEKFLRTKAIEFAKQGLSQTHLVMASFKENAVLVGYFTLANKYITVSAKKVSKSVKKRLHKFSIYDSLNNYCLSTPLIAQLGKNFANGYNKLIRGDDLLKMACDKVSAIQMDLGGKFVYLECEDKPCLTRFYKSHGFFEFDRRRLDRDETDLNGDSLVQMLKYIKS